MAETVSNHSAWRSGHGGLEQKIAGVEASFAASKQCVLADEAQAIGAAR